MTDVDPRGHWDGAWTSRPHERRSWYRPRLDRSLALLQEIGLAADTRVADVGAGASTLVDALLDEGVTDITAVDVSPVALDLLRARLGARAAMVRWVVADVLRWRPTEQADVWHDRALFHFLTRAADRRRYRDALDAALAPGGHAIIATFGPEGPTECSNLPTCRYDPESLAEAFRGLLEPVRFEREWHPTPAGDTQDFLYGLLRRPG